MVNHSILFWFYDYVQLDKKQTVDQGFPRKPFVSDAHTASEMHKHLDQRSEAATSSNLVTVVQRYKTKGFKWAPAASATAFHKRYGDNNKDSMVFLKSKNRYYDKA